jgi:hypothetical protein
MDGEAGIIDEVEDEDEDVDQEDENEDEVEDEDRTNDENYSPGFCHGVPGLSMDEII